MKIIKIVCGILVAVCVAFTAITGAEYKEREIESPPEFKGIITLWHIETFEGGFGSRKQFLLNACSTFEKRNEGVLVMVVSHTVESAEAGFEAGNYPDLISFGPGVEVNNLNSLKTEINFPYGTIGGTEYVSSWCKGGYFLIENERSKTSAMTVVQGKYNSPLTALALEKTKYSSVEVCSSQTAYALFTGGKYRFMLGTQREVYKLNNAGFECSIKPITKFNDLYQYIAVTSKEQTRAYYAQSFLELLLGEEMQKKLGSIGLMSCFFDANPEIETLKEYQSLKTENSVSAFATRAERECLKELSQKVIDGLEDEIKIKNLLL